MRARIVVGDIFGVIHQSSWTSMENVRSVHQGFVEGKEDFIVVGGWGDASADPKISLETWIPVNNVAWVQIQEEIS